MGMKLSTETKRHRKTKAALAAGAVAGTVAATAAYRRHQARLSPTLHPPAPARDTQPTTPL